MRKIVLVLSLLTLLLAACGEPAPGAGEEAGATTPPLVAPRPDDGGASIGGDTSTGSTSPDNPPLVSPAPGGGSASPDDPVSSDDPPPTTEPPASGRQRGPAYLDSVQFLFLESYPVQVRAIVKGALPTPCHRLAWEVSPPGETGGVVLDLYSIVDPDQVCIQVLEPFEEPIDVGSFTEGDYVLVIDGVEYPFGI